MSEPEVWEAATASAVRAAEEAAFEQRPAHEFMLAAAASVAAEVRRAAPSGPIVLLVGPGNNGGDALFAGAELARDGREVAALRVATAAHDGGVAALVEAGGKSVDAASEPADALAAITAAACVVDGIVGIGASPGLREPAAGLVAAIPDDCRVVAVDLPSGLAADEPSADAAHVVADVTVTFVAPKPCLLVPPAALAAGRVIVDGIGVAQPHTEADAPRRLTATGARRWWPRPRRGDDKYARGVVGVVAGSEAYPGAAVLSVSAAVRAGAGMVRYVGPRRAQDAVLAERPEAVVSGPGEHAARADAWVLGPGVADAPEQEDAIRAALATGAPCVVDAGAIGLCVEERAAGNRPQAADSVLLTPHAGELARALASLGDEVSPDDARADPLGHARRLAVAADATVLLKGAVTLVVPPVGPPWSQADAPAWLATAGAGDVLAGLAGALLAQGLPADRAGALAAHVHGRAATLASGGGPVAALDVAAAIRDLLDAREAR